MARSDPDLVDEVRSLGQYSEGEISDDELLVSVRRAKNSLILEIPEDSLNWYSEPIYEQALFWTAMLYSKVQTGELDSQAIDSDSLSVDNLPAKSVNQVTTWFREYGRAKNRLIADRAPGNSRVAHHDRTSRDGSRDYGYDS